LNVVSVRMTGERRRFKWRLKFSNKGNVEKRPKRAYTYILT